MANGEWLTQLLSGLGGAFTGEVAARGRIAEEQEMQRKLQEQQAEKERLKRIQTLRGGPMSDATQRELLQLGETPTNINALREMFTPKVKPTYEERTEDGGVSVYKDGQFSGWKTRAPRPTADRDTGPTQEEQQIGSAWLTNWLGTGPETDRMRRSVLFNQMRRQGIPYGSIGYSLMQAESVGGRQMGQDLRNRRQPTTKAAATLDDLDF
jgi:hypothetical protein